MANIPLSDKDGTTFYVQSSKANTLADPAASVEGVTVKVAEVVAALQNKATEVGVSTKIDEIRAELALLSTSVNQATGNTKLDQIKATLDTLLIELQGKADLVETQPVSVVNFPTTQPVSVANFPASQVTTVTSLPATVATADNQVTGNTALQTLLLRSFAKEITPQYVSTSISVAGDTVLIPAPAAGNHIRVMAVVVQSSTDILTTVLLKKGSSDLAPVRLLTKGVLTGLSAIYNDKNFLKCPAAQPFVLSLDGANNHVVSVTYYIEAGA